MGLSFAILMYQLTFHLISDKVCEGKNSGQLLEFGNSSLFKYKCWVNPTSVENN